MGENHEEIGPAGLMLLTRLLTDAFGCPDMPEEEQGTPLQEKRKMPKGSREAEASD